MPARPRSKPGSRGGGNWVGVHSAADTEYNWPFYGQLVGAYFKQHPAIQPATVNVEVADHPATAGLPSPLDAHRRVVRLPDEPARDATVLMTIDESTYTGGTMGPITRSSGRTRPRAAAARSTRRWATRRELRGPLFRQHLVGAIRWAAGM